jgi:hypothetical protein
MASSRHRSFYYPTLRRLVETAAEQAPKAPPQLTQEHELMPPLQQYAQLALKG